MKKAMRNKEVKEMISLIKERYKLEFSKKDKFETEENLILINNEPLFFYYENNLLPTLKLLLQHTVLKKIIVDMGAIRFVTKGADVMRPGITKIDDGIKELEFIVIVDEKHEKPLAVGIALLNTEDMKKAETGKVIKNIHYVSDEIWNYR